MVAKKKSLAAVQFVIFSVKPLRFRVVRLSVVEPAKSIVLLPVRFSVPKL